MQSFKIIQTIKTIYIWLTVYNFNSLYSSYCSQIMTGLTLPQDSTASNDFCSAEQSSILYTEFKIKASLCLKLKYSFCCPLYTQSFGRIWWENDIRGEVCLNRRIANLCTTSDPWQLRFCYVCWKLDRKLNDTGLRTENWANNTDLQITNLHCWNVKLSYTPNYPWLSVQP